MPGKGALFVVVRDPEMAVPILVADADRADLAPPSAPAQPGAAPTRRDLLDLLTTGSVIDLEPSVLAALASLDGATVTDPAGRLISAGAILKHAGDPASDESFIIEGARTTAAMTASQYGPVLKVSEDGLISFHDRTKIWDI